MIHTKSKKQQLEEFSTAVGRAMGEIEDCGIEFDQETSELIEAAFEELQVLDAKIHDLWETCKE